MYTLLQRTIRYYEKSASALFLFAILCIAYVIYAYFLRNNIHKNLFSQNLSGYQFGTVDGVPSYKAGADAAWVPFKREPIIEKASFSWAYSPSQTFPAKEGYKIVGLYADITGINSNSAVNINFGISKNLSTGKIAISGQTYVNIMGAFYCIYA